MDEKINRILQALVYEILIAGKTNQNDIDPTIAASAMFGSVITEMSELFKSEIIKF